MTALQSTAASALVHEFWRLMGTNDFTAVETLLGPEFVLDWPQSKERIRGAANFVRMNQEYPSHGPWRFTINRLVGDACTAVSDVTITDGVQHAQAISFFTIVQGKIVSLVEYWPASYAASANRAHLVETLP